MHSLKKEIIFSFYSLPLADNLKNHSVIIVTPAGVITGSPISVDEPDQAIHNFSELTSTFVDEYRTENKLDNSPLDGNDGFITLKNASLKSGNTTFNFNLLNVFYDQIIAITIGNHK